MTGGLRWAAVLIPLLQQGLAAACEPVQLGADARRIHGQHFVLDWQPEPAALRVSEFFAVIVSACHRSGRAISRLQVDATMPAHRHGMNYAPVVTSDAAGRLRANGLLLHMPGHWQITFDLVAGGERETLRAAVDLD